MFHFRTVTLYHVVDRNTLQAFLIPPVEDIDHNDDLARAQIDSLREQVGQAPAGEDEANTVAERIAHCERLLEASQAVRSKRDGMIARCERSEYAIYRPSAGQLRLLKQQAQVHDVKRGETTIDTDQLVDRLVREYVKKVVNGEQVPYNVDETDIVIDDYLRDLMAKITRVRVEELDFFYGSLAACSTRT